jgi:hypothetical protein
MSRHGNRTFGITEHPVESASVTKDLSFNITVCIKTNLDLPDVPEVRSSLATILFLNELSTFEKAAVYRNLREELGYLSQAVNSACPVPEVDNLDFLFEDDAMPDKREPTT